MELLVESVKGEKPYVKGAARFEGVASYRRDDGGHLVIAIENTITYELSEALGLKVNYGEKALSFLSAKRS